MVISTTPNPSERGQSLRNSNFTIHSQIRTRIDPNHGNSVEFLKGFQGQNCPVFNPIWTQFRSVFYGRIRAQLRPFPQHFAGLKVYPFQGPITVQVCFCFSKNSYLVNESKFCMFFMLQVHFYGLFNCNFATNLSPFLTTEVVPRKEFNRCIYRAITDTQNTSNSSQN